MQSQRIAIRAARSVRVNNPTVKRSIRQYADAAPSSNSSTGGASGSFAGGLAGGAVATILILGGWYQFSGAGKAIKSYKQTKAYVDSTVEQLKVQFKENTPEPNEALDTLKQQAYKYAWFIPGGRSFVDKLFQDVDTIRKNHAEEVDNIVKETYDNLRSASSRKNLQPSEIWNVVSKSVSRLASLSVDAAQDIANNHPELKSQLGSSFEQLQQLGDNLGPEAKKQVEETYNEMRNVVEQGISWDTVARVQKLAKEKVQSLQELGEKAWNQGFEQIKPMLEKNPQIKQMVEQNMDKLKGGNVTEALDKIKSAAQSGKAGDLQQYLDSIKSKSGDFSLENLSKWVQQAPNGSQILSQLQKLQQVGQSQGPEAKKLAEATMEDIKKVLDKRSDEVEELYKKTKKEVEDK